MTPGLIRGTWRALLLASVVVVAGAFIAACGGDDDRDSVSSDSTVTTSSSRTAATEAETLSGTITVFAAASLTDAFNEIATQFKVEHPEVDVAFNFAGSAALRTQLEQGAGADIFASADTAQMENALTSAVVADDAEVFIRNQLVVITPKDNPANVRSLADLKNSGVKLVLAAPEVPVGNYARQMFTKAQDNPAYGTGFSDAVLANVVSNEANVKQVVAKIELGEGDAGVVYGSDVTPSIAPNLNALEIPNDVNIIAEYPIALTAEAENEEAGRAFIDYVLSDDGQAILEKWGFLVS